MGTRYVRVEGLLGPSTTRVINIPTSPATEITLTSGFTAMAIFNIGTGQLLWGDSNIAVNSANILFPLSPKTWEGLQDGWSIFVRAESVSTLISATEFQV